MARPSASAVESGVFPPSEGRSSLLQPIGLMPIFTSRRSVMAFPAGPLPFPLRVLVVATGLAHALACGDFRHRHVPPAAALFGSAAVIGPDGNQVGAGGRAGTLQRLFEPGDAVHVFGL